MAASKYFLCLEFLSLMAICLSSIQDVALNFNTASKGYEMKMSQGKNTFLELISNGLFVDKTLLIDAFINYPEENLAIARPHGWGKTINLDMMRMFFEMPLHPNGTRILPISSTPNYQLFKEGKYYSNGYNITLKSPLLISQPEYSHLIKKHLGQYPLVHWSFDDIPFTDDIDETAIIAEVNKKVYDQHRYLFPKDYLRFGIGDDIPTLIKCLNDYFKKNVIVLVDGYDRFSKRRKGFGNIDLLLQHCTTFDDSYYKNKQKTILTGTEEGNLYFLEEPNTLHRILYPFKNSYGFTGTEMSLIYNHYSITKQEQNLIQYWYGGYRHDETEEKIFHPSAICSYLNTRQFESYSIHTKYNSYMKKLMKMETSLYIFTSTINGGGGFTCLCFRRTPFSCKTPSELKSLFYEGYFIDDQTHRNVIPNFQTANHLQNILAPYCTALFDRSWSIHLNETCSIWDWFLLSDEATSYKLQSNMNKCYEVMSKYYESIMERNRGGYPIPNSVKALLSAVTSIIPSKKLHFVGWQYKFFKNESVDLPRNDILLSSGARGISINIREDGDKINSVVNQSSRYMQILEQYAEFHGWKDIKFVDCKLLPYDKLEIYATIWPLNRT